VELSKELQDEMLGLVRLMADGESDPGLRGLASAKAQRFMARLLDPDLEEGRETIRVLLDGAQTTEGQRKLLEDIWLAGIRHGRGK